MATKIEVGPVGLNVAKSIKEARSFLDITRDEVAARCEAAGRPITAHRVYMIENGRTRVDVDDLGVLATALRTTVYALMRDRDLLEPITGEGKTHLDRIVRLIMKARSDGVTVDHVLDYLTYAEQQESVRDRLARDPGYRERVMQMMIDTHLFRGDEPTT